jgi:acetyl-CoA carboxylase alpha subunit
MALEDLTAPLLSGASAALSVFGISDNVSPLPLGVPVMIVVILGEVGSGHAIAQLAVTNLSVMELP